MLLTVEIPNNVKQIGVTYETSLSILCIFFSFFFFSPGMQSRGPDKTCLNTANFRIG